MLFQIFAYDDLWQLTHRGAFWSAVTTLRILLPSPPFYSHNLRAFTPESMPYRHGRGRAPVGKQRRAGSPPGLLTCHGLTPLLWHTLLIKSQRWEFSHSFLVFGVVHRNSSINVDDFRSPTCCTTAEGQGMTRLELANVYDLCPPGGIRGSALPTLLPLLFQTPFGQ